MKLFAKIATFTALLFAALFVSACEDPIESISVENGDLPQTIFVLGQEPDFSGGMLTVMRGNEREKISLGSEGVFIGGYDKTKLGEQTVTVTYRECSATFKVTTVKRIAAEQITTDYFVGEPFDFTAGAFRVTDDGGSSVRVPLTDPRLSIGGFSSETAGTVSLSVSFTDGETHYEDAVEVHVHEADSVRIKLPNKTFYKSHEETFDPSGGYITLEGDGIRRQVTLTADMVEGFDPSLATLEDNRETPYKETLTVRYAGEEKDFTISIVFSDVSVIKLRAQQCAAAYPDWTQGIPRGVDRSQYGKDAFEAMNLWFGLSAGDKAYISEDELLAVLRPATVRGVTDWTTEAAKYARTFRIEGSSFTVIGENYSTTKADYLRLQDEEEPIRAYGATLISIRNEFGDLLLTGTEPEPPEEGEEEEEEPVRNTIELYLTEFYDPEGLVELLLPRLELILTLYETLDDEVPEQWTAESLRADPEIAAKVTQAIGIVSVSPYHGYANRSLYGAVARWRPDFFEIIYSFAFADDRSAEIIDQLKDKYLPGPLERVYVGLVGGLYETVDLSDGKADGTDFMTHFLNAEAAIAEIENGGNEMYTTLFEELEFNNLLVDENNRYLTVDFGSLMQFVRTTDYGYFYVNKYGVGEEPLDALWAKYVELVNLRSASVAYASAPDYGDKVEAMLRAYVELLPMEQFSFLLTLYPNLENATPAESFDFASPASEFVAILSEYYQGLAGFGQNAFALVQTLMRASEAYAFRFNGGAQNFDAYMRTAMDEYAGLGNAQRTFNARLGYFYERYSRLYEEYNRTPSLGESEADFAAFQLAAGNALQAYEQHASPIVFLTQYERARTLKEKILSSGTEAAQAYAEYACYQGYTLDYLMLSMRLNVVGYLASAANAMGGYLLWDLYRADPNLSVFLSSAADIVEFYSNPSAQLSDAEIVKTAMKNFRALTLNGKLLVISVFAAGNEYHFGLTKFFAQAFGAETEEGAPACAPYEAAKQLFEIERLSIFRDAASGEERETFETQLEEAIATLKGLRATFFEEEERTFDELLGETYDAYLSE